VIRNLIYNASRYAVSQVSVTFTSRAGLNELRVEDDGPGIPEAERSRVFQSFVQLNPTPGKKVGYGLGLAIVKRASNGTAARCTSTNPRSAGRSCAPIGPWHPPGLDDGMMGAPSPPAESHCASCRDSDCRVACFPAAPSAESPLSLATEARIILGDDQGVYVEAADGTALLAQAAAKPVHPASVSKVPTTLALLRKLGPSIGSSRPLRRAVRFQAAHSTAICWWRVTETPLSSMKMRCW